MEEPQEQTSKLILTPLMISMVGIVFTAVAIVTYHFILTKYCARRANTTVPSSLESTERRQKQIGLEKVVLKAIPIFNYSSRKTDLFRVDQTECSVCLGDLEEGVVVRLLPNCRHSFHLRCIDEWLVSHSNCPVCRSPIEIIPIMPQLFEAAAEELVEQGGVMNGGDCVNNASGPRPEPKLQHCVSLVLLPTERTNPPLNLVLKRSLSMDYSHDVSIKIHEDSSSLSSSSSSSSSSRSRADFLRSNLCKVGGSFKHLDYASSMVIKSFSRLRRSESNKGKGIVIPC